MDDLISRQGAIECCSCLHPEDCWAEIKALPSAEPKTGEWVEYWKSAHDGTEYRWAKCSQCGQDMPGAETNFCPNCGADMRGEEE